MTTRTTRSRRSPLWRVLLALAATATAAPSSSSFSAAAPPSVLINSSVLSRRYDGFSGLSGGGATSRLLPDYAEPYRSQVLDLLFKPFFGASIHQLKVEVGGASFSGCGTEPTHMFNESDLSYARGYEWWLMGGAAARNPSILGYALPWAFPNWVGGGAATGGYPLTTQQASYMAKFCLGGPPNGWHCDAVGVWNERDWSIDYVLELRAALDSAGLTDSKIVVADGGLNDVISALAANATFRAAVSAVGVHYPSGSNSTAAAVAAGVPLWASEDSSTFFDAAGGACLARILNWNWLYGSYTLLSIWNLVTSYYDHLNWFGDSLMGAASPWSGSYDIRSPLWSAAHTAQFAWPGWRYLPQTSLAGGGGAGELPGGGTYVTLVDATGLSERVEAAVAAAIARNASLADAAPALAALRRELHEAAFAAGDAFRGASGAGGGGGARASPLHWSIVLETTTTAHSQCIRSNPARAWSVEDTQDVTFVLDEGLVLPESVVAFKSVFFAGPNEPSVLWFERQADIVVDAASRSFTVTGLHPDTVLSLSSMDRGQRKGAFAPPPPSAPFPSPYADSFAGLAVESMPRFFSDHAGSFSAMPLRGGAAAPPNATAFEQRVVAQPVGWDDDEDDSLYPFSIIGEWNMSSTSVEASVFIYSTATYSPTGGDGGNGDGGGGGDDDGGSGGASPVLSLVPCNASDAGQVWTFNASAEKALSGSIVDAQMQQCLDVDGCGGAAGSALWMWPCVTSGAGSDCNATNQQWWFDAGAGWLISRMPTELCATASSGTASAALSVQPCGGSALQAFDVDAATGLVRLRGGGGLCLCSRRPGSGPNRDDTHAGLALRLGGMTAASGGAQAYESTWFDFGYFFSLRADGSWAVTKGSGSAAGWVGGGEAAEEGRRRRRPRASGHAAGSAGPARPRRLRDSRAVLAQGALPGGGGALQQWHTLRFSAAGATLTAAIDGDVVASVQDGDFPVGWAAVTTGWHIAQFANFSMTHGYG